MGRGVGREQAGLTAMATTILERNLAALGRGSPEVARRVSQTPARADVRRVDADDGEVSLEVGEGQGRCALASRRRPREEAEALARTVDIADAAVFLVSGFGAGHHVEALARRVNRTGVVVVFEPDLGLLRAALEHVDCSAWLGAMNVAVIDRADDTGALARLVDGIEGLVAMGVRLVEHPASRARLGEATGRMHARFLDVVKAVKMTVVTTMVQVRPTLRNLTQNLDRYCTSPGVGDLAGRCRGADGGPGRPAIVVAAGPSLERNIHLLERPWVRERFVIVAVQTVLKPLLRRGVRPHFVTALDYSEISTRFYEGLRGEDVAGVTLIADAKVNPAVIEAWTRLGGALRTPGDKHLDKLLGKELAREKGTLPAGATVAHLAYYVARHLGCDPVALVGQDLGFTDGQYYAAGAAVHNLWAAELNDLNTLEMLEWQRILRMGAHLRPAVDQSGRPMYTDEQMATYLVQFERDFKADAERGLTTIDATEGGVLKAHTRVMPLAEFLEAHRGRGGDEPVERVLGGVGEGARGGGRGCVAPPSLRRVEERVAAVRNDAARIAERSRRAESLIVEMIERHADQPRVNRLIGELEKVRDDAVGRQPAFDLVQTLNQSGVFNRLRADRAVRIADHGGGLTPTERQRRQLERDLDNVRTLALAGDDLGAILDDTLAMLRTGRRTTREQAPVAGAEGGGGGGAAPPARVAAVVPVFANQQGLAEGVFDGRNALELTLQRLAACGQLTGEGAGRVRVIVPTDDPAWAASLLQRRPEGVTVEVVEMPADPRRAARRAGVRAARLLAGACWRGGIANQSVYDEVFDGAAMDDLAGRLGLDAMLLVGPDWCLVDPALCDAVVERFRRNPGQSRFTFTQAPPGVCGCVLSRALVRDLAETANRSGVFASIGGLLGYIPWTPIVDLINLPECVLVEPAVRDIGRRLVADSAGGRALIGALYGRARGEGTSGIGPAAGEIAEMLAGGSVPPPPPDHLVLTIGAGTLGTARWMDLSAAVGAMDGLCSGRAGDPCAVTIRADGPLGGVDPVDHPDFDAIVGGATRRGLLIHLRTPLTGRAVDPARLVDGSIAVVSCDVLAISAPAYLRITGRDDGARVLDAFDRLLSTRAGPWSVPWIVPRLTRCDAAYAEVDPFFRARVISCGWAVIDPLAEARPGERIAPLPVPAGASARLSAGTRVIGVDGRVRREP